MTAVKGVLLCLLSIVMQPLWAQPGDPDLKHRLRWFEQAQDSVIAHPNRLFFRWVRLDILFDPYFEIQTRPTENLKDYLSRSDQYQVYVNDSIIESYQPCDMCRFKTRRKINPASKLGSFLLSNQDKLIDDLNDLIASEQVFDSQRGSRMPGYFQTVTKAHFLYKRGQFYYLTGKAEQAIQDFKAALDRSPAAELKQQIHLALSAYYYHFEVSDSRENYRLGLKHMRLAEPMLEDSAYSQGEAPPHYLYERERLAFMRNYQDSTRYVRYLQNRAASYLNYYFSLLAMKDGPTSARYEPRRALEESQKYEWMIYDYLKETQPTVSPTELKAHKKAILGKL